MNLLRWLNSLRPSAQPTPMGQDVTKAQVGIMFGLQQWVRVSKHEVMVTAVDDLIIPPFTIDFDRPPRIKAPQIVLEDGNTIEPPPDPNDPRVYFVEVVYRNPHTNQQLDCRRNQWWLYDADGYSYEAKGSNDWLYENNGKPFLGGQRYLPPQQKLRGWLAYELPRDVVPVRLQFVDGFLRANTADFLLTP